MYQRCSRNDSPDGHQNRLRNNLSKSPRFCPVMRMMWVGKSSSLREIDLDVRVFAGFGAVSCVSAAQPQRGEKMLNPNTASNRNRNALRYSATKVWRTWPSARSERISVVFPRHALRVTTPEERGGHRSNFKAIAINDEAQLQKSAAMQRGSERRESTMVVPVNTTDP